MRIKRILLATYDYGWNMTKNRPAKKGEFYSPDDVCMCEWCADDPHYGPHYCKRYTKETARFYTDHHTRWNQEVTIASSS